MSSDAVTITPVVDGVQLRLRVKPGGEFRSHFCPSPVFGGLDPDPVAILNAKPGGSIGMNRQPGLRGYFPKPWDVSVG